jgi:hypothetical protein
MLGTSAFSVRTEFSVGTGTAACHSPSVPARNMSSSSNRSRPRRLQRLPEGSEPISPHDVSLATLDRGKKRAVMLVRESRPVRICY